MTFGQKSSRLNSRSVYCSRLYGTCFLVRPSPSAFSIEFQKNSNVICFLWQENYMFVTSKKRCHWNSLMSEKYVKSRWLQLSCTIPSGFPTQRLIEKNNYVAAVWNDGEVLQKKCPKACRRYPDWVIC